MLALHAFVLYVLLLEYRGTEKVAATRYSQLLFIVTQPKPVVKASEPLRLPALKNRPGKRAVAIAPVEAEPPKLAEMPLSTPPADLFSENARVDIDSLVKLAGKADRETRQEKEVKEYGPAPGSMEAIMTRAFTEAKLAVPLKWYEAARIEEFSAPGARKPIYQVKTAFGTYCLYYPDKLTEGTGQPKMAGCPRSTGR
jgi:hypothetical protein